MENQIFSSFSMTMNNDFFFWYLILQLKDEAYVDPLFRPLPPLPSPFSDLFQVLKSHWINENDKTPSVLLRFSLK